MVVLLLIIVGICALGVALATFGRAGRPDEVERFHRARAMTTEWSRHHGVPGLPLQQHEEHEHQRERETADH